MNWWQTVLVVAAAIVVVPWVLVLAGFLATLFLRYLLWVEDFVRERWD